ncbi:MAG: hypothetical protein ACI88H_000130 [Cocleimonas sp.]|jgi:hypothetical protein
MPELIEGQHPGEHIVHEESIDLSREVVTIGSGAGIVVSGTVLGKKTADSKYFPHDPAAVDGTEVASRILWRKVDATSVDVTEVVTKALTKVRDENLTWKVGMDAGDKTAAITALEVQHITVQLQY